MKRFIFISTLVLINLSTLASNPQCPCCYTSSYPTRFVLFYLGKMTNDNLGQVLTFDYSTNQDTLYSFEIGQELNPCNPFRVFFQPIVSTVDIRGNVTLLDDAYGHIFEFTPYFSLNWCNFPWQGILRTILSFGEGVSYVTKIPQVEEHNSDRSKKLLNYLLFEVAFALPNYSNWELTMRIHHRSGAFGLYNAKNAGSTAIGVGLRYRFS